MAAFVYKSCKQFFNCKNLIIFFSTYISIEMFKKPFRVKSQVQLKSSEKKTFSSDVKALFPTLSDEDFAQLCNNKENIVKTKIVTHSEELIELYLVDKTPMFFDIVDQNVKLPTVYMCWKFPHMIPKFTTNSVVLEKLKNGADLFLPGVYMDTVDFRNSTYISKDAAGVNVIDNAAVLAVGVCIMSKSDVMSEASMLDGRLLKVYHTVGDFLCKSHPQPVPHLNPPLRITDRMMNQMNGEDSPLTPEPESLPVEELRIIGDPTSPDDGNNEELRDDVSIATEEEKPIDERAKMDELLTYCFIKAIKTAPKTIYPILPAAFYANHILHAVPPGETLNVKKTKWKKLSGLLQEMATEGVVKLETVRANEYRIVSANTSHNLVREFVDPHHTPVTVDASPSLHATTSVQEVFVVSIATQPIFKLTGLQKGDEVTRVDVRTAVTDYIKRNGLALPETPDKVRPDPALRNAIKGSSAQETFTRMEVLAGVLASMPLRHKVSSGGDLIVHKANLPLVEYEVVTRSGNKKVTLISNVEGYGVDVSAFAKALQHAAAASTSVTNAVPGKKGPQVQVQGNQVLIAARLLTENHGIAEKYMRGLEKAPKSKKK